MANKNYSSTKASQKNSDQAYEGEQGMSGMGQMAKTGEAVSRDNVANFQKGDQTNPMQGHGARQPQQAEYTVPKDNWR